MMGVLNIPRSLVWGGRATEVLADASLATSAVVAAWPGHRPSSVRAVLGALEWSWVGLALVAAVLGLYGTARVAPTIKVFGCVLAATSLAVWAASVSLRPGATTLSLGVAAAFTIGIALELYRAIVTWALFYLRAYAAHSVSTTAGGPRAG